MSDVFIICFVLYADVNIAYFSFFSPFYFTVSLVIIFIYLFCCLSLNIILHLLVSLVECYFCFTKTCFQLSSIFLSVCLSFYLSVCLSVFSSICSFCLFIYLYLQLSIYPSIHPSIYLFIYTSTFSSIHLHNLSIYPSIYPSNQLF